MMLGAATHFAQGWPVSELSKNQALNFNLLRDSLYWSETETVKGQIDLTTANAKKLDQVCASGTKIIMTQHFKNPLYDGGNYVYSAAGRQAFAKYIRALADHYGSCIAAFEIGNEINGGGGTGLSYPSGYDLEDSYVAMLKDIKSAMGGTHSDISILGGSTNMIGTGFLEGLFGAGMLNYVDGVAVHPYQGYAAGMDFELKKLRAAMSAHGGGSKEIWIPEWAHDHADQNLSAGQAIMSATMMAEQGVKGATWYALLEESWFPNLGLYNGSSLKKQGKALKAVATHLLPHGNPVRLDLGDPGLFAYRFGTGATVVWGTPRTISVSGASAAYDMLGNPLTNKSSLQVSDDPVMFVGGSISNVGSSSTLADTLLQFGTGEWRYFARNAAGDMNELHWVNNWYDGVYRSDWDAVVYLGPYRAIPARDGNDPMRVLWQWKSDEAVSVTVTACFTKEANGDGIDVAINRNGSAVATGFLSSGEKQFSANIDLAAGDRVMISAGPNQTWGGDKFQMRARIYRKGSAGAVPCPEIWSAL
ncbi:hypothetical protein GCM10010990_19380 [Croceicoccus mobilis]|uniref:Glycoside hydrolase family 5 domain-containing protein n=2 Tax=Croceicoccus mobilis TaxID=1703339 RepID=A0A917DTW4_9SPHN|nr:hypothetical protein GCM10010990_19380 [Croceicoccus mobilis]